MALNFFSIFATSLKRICVSETLLALKATANREQHYSQCGRVLSWSRNKEEVSVVLFAISCATWHYTVLFEQRRTLCTLCGSVWAQYQYVGKYGTLETV